MKICYLLESTDLGGGVRVVFDQARALIRRGHRVSVRALRGDHRWYPHAISVDYVPFLDDGFATGDCPDAVICTYWTTVEPAIAIGAHTTLHLCQGFEADIPELAADHEAIMAAYRRQIPKITVGPWLAERLQAVFGTTSFQVLSVGQCVDTELHRPGNIPIKFYLPRFIRSRLDWNILVAGDYMISCKGVSDALYAVARLRETLPRVRLTRVSLYPLSDEERRITDVNAAYSMLPPKDMVDLYRQADVLISTALPPEGFGLPAAEAMASGVPAILTRIPSYLGFDGRQDYALFVDIHSPEAVAEGVLGLVRNRKRYLRLRERGAEVVQHNFSADRVALNIERAIAEFRRAA